MAPQRKRKIIAPPDAPPSKDIKLDDTKKGAEKEDRHLPQLTDLPLLALATIASHLSFKDQAKFERACSGMKQAVKFFWRSQRTFNYEDYTARLFQMDKDLCRPPLPYHHIALQNISNVFLLYTKYAIRNLSFRTLPLLTADDLDNIVLTSERNASEIFGSVRQLDLQDVCLNYEELQWFSRVSPHLASLKLTLNALAMGTFPNKESETSEEELHRLLSTYVRNYATEVKPKKYPYPYLQLLVSVHDLFKCLGEVSVY